VAVVAVVALLTMLAATGTATAADWQYVNADSDAYYDITAIDRDDSGFFEDIRFDLDNDGRWDTRLYNTRLSESFLEILSFDMDENGNIETQLRDADQREGFDYILVDRDQNGYWDPWRGYTQRIIPGSHLDHVTASNRRNASSALIHNTRQQTGVSLLYPSLPGGY
jgi:hypothetical protein